LVRISCVALMQDAPLVLPHFFDRAERLFPTRRSSRPPATGRERITYGEWAAAPAARRRARHLGISADGRVATFAWNTARHLELYFAAPCSGRVLHTLNIRLFPEQLTYIANHAEDEVIFVDRSLCGLLWPLLKTFETVRHIVVMDDGKGGDPADPSPHRGARLRGAAGRASPSSWNVDDENRAARACATRAAPPATPRASCTPTAPRSCTRSAR
jgi:fatty-acyl-CoA synthase